MRALKNRRILLIAAIFAAFAALFMLFLPKAGSADASTVQSSGGYEITNFEAVYDVQTSGLINVTETLEINYTSAKSNTVTRALPSDGSDRVRNIRVYEYENGALEETEYEIDSESDSVEVGLTAGAKTYVIYYDYYSKSQSASVVELIPLSGLEAKIVSGAVTVNLPYTITTDITVTLGGSAVSYTTTDTSVSVTLTDIEEGTALYIGVGVDGAIGVYDSGVQIYALIGAAVVLVLALLIKFLFFNKQKLKIKKSSQPPAGMDPLIVGKLVDNTVNDGDITSVIFYWASQGYVEINQTNNDDIAITKIRGLAAMAPDYQQTMFYKMFEKSDKITLKTLDENFYKTCDKVKKKVDERVKGSYSNRSMAASLIFALVGGFAMAIAPTIYAMIDINTEYSYITGLIFLLPALIVYAVTESLMYYRFKIKKATFGVFLGLIILLSAACTAIYAVVVPDNIIEAVIKVFICVFSYATVIISTLLISRTPRYNAQLEEILGFRQFIISADAEEIKALLKKDSQLFYSIYPYACVLNSEREWTAKFAGSVPAPDWSADAGSVIPAATAAAEKLRTARIRITAAISTAPNAIERRKRRQAAENN